MSTEKQIEEILDYVKSIDKRMGKLEKTLGNIDTRLEKIEDCVNKLEQWVPTEYTPVKRKKEHA